MQFGDLEFAPVESNLDLVANPVSHAIKANRLSNVVVAKINPELADTAAFCEKYGVGMNESANCVIVEAKRADKTWYAACLVLATARADINGIVRRQLGARKISFAPMDVAVSLTGMEYGGITPVGLPSDWTILVDTAVATSKYVIIGSGIRKTKLLVEGSFFSSLPNVVIKDITRKSV